MPLGTLGRPQHVVRGATPLSRFSDKWRPEICAEGDVTLLRKQNNPPGTLEARNAADAKIGSFTVDSKVQGQPILLLRVMKMAPMVGPVRSSEKNPGIGPCSNQNR